MTRFYLSGLMRMNIFSDYVGRVEWESDALYLAYRYRLDNDDFYVKT